MSKDWRHTWQYWGEERRQRSLLKEHNNWKQEAMSDLEEVHESVFLIVNEWTANDEDDVSEIVALFHTENAAWDELHEIAKEFNIILDPDETSFSPPSPGLSINEAYYIEERQFND